MLKRKLNPKFLYNSFAALVAAILMSLAGLAQSGPAGSLSGAVQDSAGAAVLGATNITSNEGSLTNNIAPAPETLSEVKLQTSLYDASTGRSGGGNFQLVTKGGGNTFNGSAYYYLQNEKLNANDFFFNKDGIDRPRARRNEGGFTIGGPAIKEKFFFFGGYQRTQASTAFVPTASSISVTPQALQLISGARIRENLFTQGYDLNDPNVPDFLFDRFNQAYVAAGSPNGALNAGATARARGVGRAFGFANTALGGLLDYNLANAGGAVITFEGRSPYLGFDVPEAILLGNSAFSKYHSAQFSLNKRFSRGLQFNLAYTFSKSMDNASTDPGSTAGGGKPDLPNAGFTAQGNAFNTRANYALSDFDRPHRFSASYVYDLPAFGSKSRFLTGWQNSGFYQVQSGTPFSIFAAETTAGTAAQYTNVRLGSAGLYRIAFGRPSLCGTLDQLRQSGSDKTESYFNPSVLCSPLSLAGGYPNNRGFGNLGRNILRGTDQQRFDLGFAKNTQFTERIGLEFRWEIFNLANHANFATPNNVIGEAGTDYGKITDTIGGPRVMQFGLKLKF